MLISAPYRLLDECYRKPFIILLRFFYMCITWNVFQEQDPRQTGFLTRARATAVFLKAYMLGRKEAPPVTSNLQDTEMTCQAHSSNDRAAAVAQEILESSSAFEELPQSDQREQQRQLEMMQKLLSEAMSILEQEDGSDGGGNDSDIRGSSRHRDDEDVERIRFTASS